jgi:hypothetical protein
MISGEDIEAMKDDQFIGWGEDYVVWYKELVSKGHTPALDLETNRINMWVLSEGFHNGPGCSTCGYSWCMHCIDSVNKCRGK